MARGTRGRGRGGGQTLGRGQLPGNVPIPTTLQAFPPLPTDDPRRRADAFQSRIQPAEHRQHLYRTIRPTSAFATHLERIHRDRQAAERAYNTSQRPLPPSHFGGRSRREISHRIADTVAEGNRSFNQGHLLFSHRHSNPIGYAWEGEAPPREQRLPHGRYRHTNMLQVAFDPAQLENPRRGYGFLSAYPVADPRRPRRNPNVIEFSTSSDDAPFPGAPAPFSDAIPSAAVSTAIRAARSRGREEPHPSDLGRGPMGGPGRDGPPQPPPGTAPQQLTAARGGSMRSSVHDKMQQFFNDLIVNRA